MSHSHDVIMEARHRLLFSLALAFLAFAGPAPRSVSAAVIPGLPDDVTAFDPRELALLPQYCKYTQVFSGRVPGGNNPAEIDKWKRIMGPSFSATHHYCWGLMKTNRALIFARDKQAKTFYLGDAIGEYDYVLTNATPDFILRPEILMRKGQNLVRLGKGSLGVVELEKAIDLKPDYWPPYAELSDFYKSVGDSGKAREYLDKALGIAPDAEALQKRRAELDAPSKKR